MALTLEFDPNNKKPPVIEWATFIPTRSTAPKFKAHTNRGHALNAIGESDAILYHWEDEEWKEVYRTEGFIKLEECENCGKNLVTPIVGTNRSWISGIRIWANRDKLVPNQIFVCYECKRKLSK
jgi:hypothetical protein